MVSKSAVLINILLASVVLAVPSSSSSSRLEARLARRRENRQSAPMNSTDAPDGATFNTKYSTNWSGVASRGSQGTFTNVTGTFTVPIPSGSDGSASAWVGIDGWSCPQAILQTGVDFTISGGQVSYDSWFEWFPDYAHDFVNFPISGGDKIKLIVTASSTISGEAIIENLSTGLVVIQGISSTVPLCQQDAEWIVEDYKKQNSLVPFADFGRVMFTGAIASDSRGSIYTTDNASTIDLWQNGAVLTSVSASGDNLTVSYV